MRIEQDNQGWRIEPDTSNEETFLKYLFDALRKAYTVSVEAPSTMAAEAKDGNAIEMPKPNK